MLVPQEGLEPSRHKTLVPKTSVSTIPPPRHVYHIRRAFYFQLREIVSNLTLLTAVRVPEDMIYFVPPTGFEPVAYCLEGSCSIHLSYEGKFWYSERESNPHGHKAHKILSLACLPVPPPEHLLSQRTMVQI